MSENSGAKNNHSVYENMSTEQINNMLRNEAFSGEKLDMELVDSLLVELKRREPYIEGISVQEAWQDFKNNWADVVEITEECSEKTIKFRRSFKKVLIAAVIVVLLVSTLVGVNAFSGSGIGPVARWTTGRFSFGSTKIAKTEPPDDFPPLIYDNWEEGNTYNSLQDVLDDFCISEFSVPDIPEGFELLNVNVFADEEDLIFTGRASYKKEGIEGVLHVSCKHTVGGTRTDTIFVKDDAEPIVFSDGRYEYHMFSNNSHKEIVWTTDNFLCSIGGPVSYEELKEMVSTIYDD